MGKPFYFDLAEIEAGMKEMMERESTRAMNAAEDDADRDVVMMQKELDPIIISTMLWHVNCVNRERDTELTAESLGYAIGIILRNFDNNCDIEAVPVILRAAQDAYRMGEDSPLYAGHQHFEPKQGGNA